MASTPTDSGESLLSTLTGALAAVVNFSADDIAKALGVWFAAKAAISTVASGVAEIVTHGTIQGVQAKYTDIPLSAVQLADMVVRNVLPDPAGGSTGTRLTNIEGHDVYAEAAFTGIDPQRMNALILDTGESYGVIDALRLYNRGLSMYGLNAVANPAAGAPLYSAGASLQTEYGITQAELQKVIYYSRIRNEFTPDLLKLARNTLSPADAVELAVKQIVDMSTATDLFVAAGGVKEQFDALVAGAGDSIGVEKAVELYAHKTIDEETLRNAVAMSRMNPRFYPLTEVQADGTIPLNHKWLPPYEIREAVTAGTITAATALTWMLEMGYAPDQAQAFAGALGTGTVAATKHETAGMVLAEYQAKLLTEAEATTALENLGYTTASIPFFLQYAQARAVVSARDTAVSRIRQGYLLGLTSTGLATNSLSQVGVPQAAITAYLADWDAEASVPHTALTTAEIGKLLEGGHVATADAEALWKMKGYTTADISYLLALYPPPAVTPPVSDTGLT
jgi:hypothetical protein